VEQKQNAVESGGTKWWCM